MITWHVRSNVAQVSDVANGPLDLIAGRAELFDYVLDKMANRLDTVSLTYHNPIKRYVYYFEKYILVELNYHLR